VRWLGRLFPVDHGVRTMIRLIAQARLTHGR
jgi:hypothetical protein